MNSAKEKLLKILDALKKEMADAVAFAMEPVIYNFPNQ